MVDSLGSRVPFGFQGYMLPGPQQMEMSELAAFQRRPSYVASNYQSPQWSQGTENFAVAPHSNFRNGKRSSLRNVHSPPPFDEDDRQDESGIMAGGGAFRGQRRTSLHSSTATALGSTAMLARPPIGPNGRRASIPLPGSSSRRASLPSSEPLLFDRGIDGTSLRPSALRLSETSLASLGGDEDTVELLRRPMHERNMEQHVRLPPVPYDGLGVKVAIVNSLLFLVLLAAFGLLSFGIYMLGGVATDVFYSSSAAAQTIKFGRYGFIVLAAFGVLVAALTLICNRHRRHALVRQSLCLWLPLSLTVMAIVFLCAAILTPIIIKTSLHQQVTGCSPGQTPTAPQSLPKGCSSACLRVLSTTASVSAFCSSVSLYSLFVQVGAYVCAAALLALAFLSVLGYCNGRQHWGK